MSEAAEISSGLGWLAFFAATFAAAAAISAGLAFYFVKNKHFSDGEASAMFALIFAIAAFVTFLIYHGRSRQTFNRIAESARTFGRGVSAAGRILVSGTPAQQGAVAGALAGAAVAKQA